MERSLSDSRRAVVPGLSTILLVAVTVIVAATLAVFVLDIGESVNDSGPSASFEAQPGTDSSGNTVVQVTLTAGGPVAADQLLLVATDPVDLGGPDKDPDRSGTYTTRGEKLTEGNDQTGIGEEWQVGETIYVGGTDLDGTTIRLVWNPVEVDKDDEGGRAPSKVVGENSEVLWEHTIDLD